MAQSTPNAPNTSRRREFIPSGPQQREIVQNNNSSAKKNSNNNTEYIDLVELFFRFVYNWKSFLMVMLLGAVAAAAYHTYMVKPTYQASTEIYVTNSDSVISFQDLQIGSALTADYQSIITSRGVLNKVIADLQLNTTYKGLRSLISVSNPTGTRIIRTNVTTTNLELSRDIANDLLQVSIERIFQIVGTNEPTIIDYAEAQAVENVTPSFFRSTAIGSLLGAVIVAAVVTLQMLLDTTIKTEDDIKKYLQLPVLTAIPYFEE